MIILSKGYKLPQSPDTGDVFFPAIEFDIQRLNDHHHDGINSQLLGSATQNILAVNWVAAPIAGGVFRQQVTMPTGYLYDVSNMWFKLSTGEFVYPSIERVSANQYFIYTNDNTLQYTAYYR
jgi:hypothetical protein